MKLLILFSELIISSALFGTACQFPSPSWILPIKNFQLASSETLSREKMAVEIKREIDELRVVCNAEGGEAFWYRLEETECFSIKTEKVLCEQSGEVECEAKDE